VTLSNTVEDYHDHVVAMLLRKLHTKVNTDDVPLICWSLHGVELSIRSMVLQLGLIAKVTGFDIDSVIYLDTCSHQ
jgi:hypothetical protein